MNETNPHVYAVSVNSQSDPHPKQEYVFEGRAPPSHSTATVTNHRNIFSSHRLAAAHAQKHSSTSTQRVRDLASKLFVRPSSYAADHRHGDARNVDMNDENNDDKGNREEDRQPENIDVETRLLTLSDLRFDVADQVSLLLIHGLQMDSVYSPPLDLLDTGANPNTTAYMFRVSVIACAIQFLVRARCRIVVSLAVLQRWYELSSGGSQGQLFTHWHHARNYFKTQMTRHLPIDNELVKLLMNPFHTVQNTSGEASTTKDDDDDDDVGLLAVVDALRFWCCREIEFVETSTLSSYNSAAGVQDHHSLIIDSDNDVRRSEVMAAWASQHPVRNAVYLTLKGIDPCCSSGPAWWRSLERMALNAARSLFSATSSEAATRTVLQHLLFKQRVEVIALFCLLQGLRRVLIHSSYESSSAAATLPVLLTTLRHALWGAVCVGEYLRENAYRALMMCFFHAWMHADDPRLMTMMKRSRENDYSSSIVVSTASSKRSTGGISASRSCRMTSSPTMCGVCGAKVAASHYAVHQRKHKNNNNISHNNSSTDTSGIGSITAVVVTTTSPQPYPSLELSDILSIEAAEFHSSSALSSRQIHLYRLSHSHMSSSQDKHHRSIVCDDELLDDEDAWDTKEWVTIDINDCSDDLFESYVTEYVLTDAQRTIREQTVQIL